MQSSCLRNISIGTFQSVQINSGVRELRCISSPSSEAHTTAMNVHVASLDRALDHA